MLEAVGARPDGRLRDLALLEPVLTGDPPGITGSIDQAGWHIPESGMPKRKIQAIIAVARQDGLQQEDIGIGSARQDGQCDSYGCERLLFSQLVSGSHSSQSGQARYSGSSKMPRPRV